MKTIREIIAWPFWGLTFIGLLFAFLFGKLAAWIDGGETIINWRG